MKRRFPFIRLDFGDSLLKSKVAGLALLLTGAALLLTYNLENWPVTWYDEGTTLQASKNLALLGRYGLLSSEGFRWFDPLISTGPTVIVPIALVFKLWGVGLFQARLVMVLYALATVLILFVLAHYLFGTRTAVAASLLFIATPNDLYANVIGLGRLVMGEVPALFFLGAGSLLWLRSVERGHLLKLIGSGVLLGMAIVTKQQNFLVLAALGFVWAIDWLRERQLGSRHLVIPLLVSLGCVLLWSGYQAAALGWSRGEQLGVLERLSLQATVGLGSPRLILRGIRVLAASGALIWGVPGLVYGLYLSVRRETSALRIRFVLCLCLVWLVWFLFGSIGWLRYVFPALALMNIFTAKLLADLSGGFAVSLPPVFRDSKQDVAEVARRLAVTLALAFMILTPLQQQVLDIVRARDTTPFEFAKYLREAVPQGALIESFEPEIVFLTDHTFHQPSLPVLNAAVRHVQFGLPYPPDVYDFEPYAPAYLINGVFGKYTDLYTKDLADGCCTLMGSIGAYDLYKINPQVSGK